MTALIIGGDRLGNIPGVLHKKGIQDYVHWTGRKKGTRNMSIPNHIDIVIVLYDFVEHNLVERIKLQSKRAEIPCIFSRRACSDLVNKIEYCKNCGKCKH